MVRAGLIAGLLILLAACGREDAREPGAPGDIPASLPPRFYPPEGWAWDTLPQEKPQRYGVAAPRSFPAATIIILPGYGEPAEVWFETAADLIAQGYTVWILDRAGQGGSARYASPHDLGFVPAFDTDSKGLQTFLGAVVKPRPDDVVVVLAHADAAATALVAIGAGLKVDGLIASSAELATTKGSPLLKIARRADTPPFGWRPWREDGPDDHFLGRTHDRERGGLRHTWMLSKPNLRLSGPSMGWLEAFSGASREAAEASGKVAPAVLMVNPNQPASNLCSKLPACREEELSGARTAIHLEADRWRGPWLDMIDGFIAGRVAVRQRGIISAASTTPYVNRP